MDKLTAEQVRELFDYNPEEGYLRHRLPRKQGQRHEVGDVAGRMEHGYHVVHIGSASYKAHRVIWLWVYGEEPSRQIDHINLNKNDNRLTNLRLATNSENQRNTRIRKDNRARFKGVTRKRWGWQARVHVNGVTTYLGVFSTPEQAHAAYCAAAKSMHGEFARSA